MDRELLEILACPVCKGSLTPGRNSLRCEACRLRYPVVDGVPVLLPERAKKF